MSIGLLFNGGAFRLVHDPRGESSEHVTFHLAEMCESAGRPILGGLTALLSAERLFNVLEPQRFLHGAACHGCLLIPEQSCERHNEYLDRALVVPTVAALRAEQFREDDLA